MSRAIFEGCDRILGIRGPMAVRYKKKLIRVFGLLFLGSLSLSCLSHAMSAGLGDEEVNIEKHAVKRVLPVYPTLAQRYRIEGVVIVQVAVGKDGKVTKAEFVRGQNIFRSVSLDAAKRWEFKSDGALEGTIHFTFKLTG